jgi:hypothetical protein
VIADVSRIIAVWSNAALSRYSSDSVVAVSYENLTARIHWMLRCQHALHPLPHGSHCMMIPREPWHTIHTTQHGSHLPDDDSVVAVASDDM